MNNIDTSAIVDPTKQQPFLGGSLAFLQSGNKEIIRGICRSIMGEANYALSSTKVIILSGCNFSSLLNTIFEGLMFYADEAFYFPGASGLNSYSNIPVIKTDYTYVSPDPITYSDGSTGSVHNQRRLKVVDDVSGSGVCDLKDAIYISQNNGTKFAISPIAVSTGTPTAISGATFTTPKSISSLKRKFKIKIFGKVYFNYGLPYDLLTIDIYNSTTSTILATSTVGIHNTAGSTTALTGATYYGNIYVEYDGAFEGNTTITGLIYSGGGTSNFDNAFFIVEEYH